MGNNFDRKFEEALFYLAFVMPHANKLVKPTFFHCVRVAISLYESSHNKDVCIAALLHDSIEDAGLTLKEIQERFGSEVATLVEANTKSPIIRDETEQTNELLERVINAGEEASIIKAADILDNLGYFRKIGKTEAIKKLMYMGNRLLEFKPDNYTDSIFETLKFSLNS